jgi:hypothetical protein
MVPRYIYLAFFPQGNYKWTHITKYIYYESLTLILLCIVVPLINNNFVVVYDVVRHFCYFILVKKIIGHIIK